MLSIRGAVRDVEGPKGAKDFLELSEKLEQVPNLRKMTSSLELQYSERVLGL